MAALELSTEDLEAVRRFAWIWSDGWLLRDIGPTLTCSEADALAGLLRALGKSDAAERLLEGHATGDEPDDDHYIDIEGEES